MQGAVANKIQSHMSAMKTSALYGSLIRAIEGVYFRVTLSILHKRMDGYHQQSCKNITPYAGNIKKPLLECIDVIVFNGLVETTASEHEHVEDAASQYVPEKYNVTELHLLNKDKVAELAQYFKSKHNDSMLHAGVEEKLEHSTWEHIHAVVRCAKQGNDRRARMHADIASTACLELAHFMVDEQYAGFLNEIEKYLSVLITRQ